MAFHSLVTAGFLGLYACTFPQNGQVEAALPHTHYGVAPEALASVANNWEVPARHYRRGLTYKHYFDDSDDETSFPSSSAALAPPIPAAVVVSHEWVSGGPFPTTVYPDYDEDFYHLFRMQTQAILTKNIIRQLEMARGINLIREVANNIAVSQEGEERLMEQQLKEYDAKNSVKFLVYQQLGPEDRRRIFPALDLIARDSWNGILTGWLNDLIVHSDGLRTYTKAAVERAYPGYLLPPLVGSPAPGLSDDIQPLVEPNYLVGPQFSRTWLTSVIAAFIEEDKSHALYDFLSHLNQLFAMSADRMIAATERGSPSVVRDGGLITHLTWVAWVFIAERYYEPASASASSAASSTQSNGGLPVAHQGPMANLYRDMVGHEGFILSELAICVADKEMTNAGAYISHLLDQQPNPPAGRGRVRRHAVPSCPELFQISAEVVLKRPMGSLAIMVDSRFAESLAEGQLVYTTDV
ncbi:hypothetical protein H4R33_002591 [Dimargaris cristalligena]|uniref:Uncharacterized protein n=1 Tax=Dimargaris cristalligena TaxID=215637 RepID=A0A4P9ZRJ6_9FUNG|nr:hypothetical protein H4R33_002591 [Dimargaris cristalligena]RKP36144.1 hypothetical protein BJ085DRAFT_36887 [Dimargaris cristalligena]|eukprot:RKP36144.1 hypothetical protein BJ085DRAFT_36887 [Dimargaris cristalligena]